MVVVITVNGQVVTQAGPDGAGPKIDVTKLPALPWVVEARTVGGRLLLTMNVEPGTVTQTTNVDGTGGGRGALARADLSCGMLVLVAGKTFSYGPAPDPNAGAPGDCDP